MFLLVPAHPGCPGQIPQSRKMVVCVCVCVCALLEYVQDHPGEQVPERQNQEG